jgi:hypothetical protein
MQNSGNQNPSAEAPIIPDQGISFAADAKVPGFDLIDGVANVLFCPGRAIMLQTAPPGQGLSGKDLPVVILLSAAVWYGCYWLATSGSSPLQSILGGEVPAKKRRVFRVPVKGKVISSDEEEQSEEDLEDED